MKAGKVRLTRDHTSGHVKIRDRKEKRDDKKNIIKGKYVEVIHRLSVDSFQIELKPLFQRDGVTQLKDDYGREKNKKIIVGKPFDVHDVDYVMENHGTILEVI